ncbi:MAG: zinc ABC transporter substrate-binding protein [Hyphomicrobiales bacterium]|nr:zinc ABC transporter substrate-binding protein [Hyphomicrobiales bacterium]
MLRYFLPLMVCLAMSPLAARAETGKATLHISAADAVYANIARQIAGNMATVSVDPALARGTVVEMRLQGHVQRLAAGVPERPGAGAYPSPAWLHVDAMTKLARNIAAALAALDPGHKRDIDEHLKDYEDRLAPVAREMALLREKYRGSAVFVTDPAFANMLDDLHFGIRNRASLATLDDKGPARMKAVKSLGQRITEAAAGVLIYRLDAHDIATDFLKKAADQAGVPSVGIWSDLPSGLNYQRFILRELLTLHGALNEAAP